MKTALCLLTFNERACLEIVFPTIPKPGAGQGFDSIYAIDGGSKDGTIEFLEERGVQVIRQKRRGRGDAFLTAFAEIQADAYIFFSPDGNEDVHDIKKFAPLLSNGSDIVIASRMMPESVNEEDGQLLRWRKWANNAFNLLANVAFRREGPFITDSINGFRGITKKAATRLRLDAVDYTIEYQMTIRAMKHRMKISEFATIEGQRVAGETGARSIPTGIRFLRRLKTELLTQPDDTIEPNQAHSSGSVGR